MLVFLCVWGVTSGNAAPAKEQLQRQPWCVATIVKHPHTHTQTNLQDHSEGVQMLPVVHHHDSTHGESFQPVHWLQYGSLKTVRAQWVCSRVKGTLTKWSQDQEKSQVRQHQRVCVCVLYLHSLGRRLQLCHRVVVRQDVRQLALSNQRREGGQCFLQLADPLLLSL